VIRRDRPAAAAWTLLPLLLLGGTPAYVAFAQDETREPVTATEVLQAVRGQVARQLGVETKRIAPGRPLKEYGADELDIVELVMALEEEFDIEIPDAAVNRDGPRGWEEIITAQRFADVVMQQLREKR
jgi:acyl carrier protein